MLALRTAVARHAVLKIADPLFEMLRSNAFRLMFMASKASIAAKAIVDMTGCARRDVVAIENEELRMVKCCRFPALLTVTLTAGSLEVAVNSVIWSCMASPAICTHHRVEERVGELCLLQCRKA